jgi:hypothetical protein
MADPTIPVGHRDHIDTDRVPWQHGLEPDEGFLPEALQQLTQTVVELEAAKQNAASRCERTPERKRTAMVSGNGCGKREWERSLFAFRRCETEGTSRAWGSPAGGSRKPSWRWYSKPMWKGSARGRWMICCRRSG